jgi:hypothetical protein
MFKVLSHLIGRSGYNKKGEEIPDPVPAALQIDLEAEMPLHEKVLRAIQSPGWNKKMEETGMETFDEANDFYVPDELPEFKSIHEDESGDVIAYEEGVRSGFVEEIPAERRSQIKKQQEKYTELIKNHQNPKKEDK